MNPLTLFSGPYAVLARLACYAVVALAIAAGGAYAMHHWDAGDIAAAKAETLAVQTAFDKFKADVASAGKVAQAKADAETKAAQLAKDQADANHKKAVDTLTADNKRLLDGRSRSSYLPTASAGAGSPETACLNRADTESALRRFDAGVAGLLGEGDEAISGLNTGRNWVKSVGENLH